LLRRKQTIQGAAVHRKENNRGASPKYTVQNGFNILMVTHLNKGLIPDEQPARKAGYVTDI
jgi:hypothetical protein